ncbi:MAG: hypothetical protein AAF098_10640 [Pseudomonadota bacterium]
MKTIILVVVSFALLDVGAWALDWNWLMHPLSEVRSLADILVYLVRFPLAICIYFLLDKTYISIASNRFADKGSSV